MMVADLIFTDKLDDPALYDRNVSTAAHALNQAMESMIYDNFDHYMWGYRRFKHVPIIEDPYRVDGTALADFIRAHHNHGNSNEQAKNGSSTNLSKSAKDS